MSAPVPGRRCSHAAGCELFPSFQLQGALRVWQIYYCEAQFESCARFKLSMAGHPVPRTLLPNGKELAKELVPLLQLKPQEEE